MATKTDTTRLEIAARESGSSRATRRLRREGRVPGVLYGRGQEPLSFSVDARELRHALAGHGAVLELTLGDKSTPAVLKDSHKHPVRGDLLHVDMLRVDLNKPIQAIVTIELTGTDDAPGVKEGGVLEHVTREVTIEALPADIPESIVFDVSGLNVADTVYLSALQAPAGVTIVIAEDTEDAVVATVTPPRVSTEGEGDELETETQVVGEAASAGNAEPDAGE